MKILTNQTILAAFVLLLFAACQETKTDNNTDTNTDTNTENKADISTDFNYRNMAFNLPDAWAIVEIDSSETDYFSLIIEPQKKDGTSFVFMEWGEGLFNIEEQLGYVQKGYTDNPDLKQAGIKFSDFSIYRIAGQEGLRSNFTFSLVGIEQEGQLFCFQFCNKTISLVLQYAVMDKEKAETAFAAFQKSLICTTN